LARGSRRPGRARDTPARRSPDTPLRSPGPVREALPRLRARDPGAPLHTRSGDRTVAPAIAPGAGGARGAPDPDHGLAGRAPLRPACRLVLGRDPRHLARPPA